MMFAYVEWVDSSHHEEWTAAEDLEEIRSEVSCGILVRETADQVVLALSYATMTKQYGQVVAIPRVAITKFKSFKGPRVPRPGPRSSGG